MLMTTDKTIREKNTQLLHNEPLTDMFASQAINQSAYGTGFSGSDCAYHKNYADHWKDSQSLGEEASRMSSLIFYHIPAKTNMTDEKVTGSMSP